MTPAKLNVGESWRYTRGSAIAKIKSIVFDNSYNDYMVSFEWQLPIKSDNNRIVSSMFLRNFERIKDVVVQ